MVRISTHTAERRGGGDAALAPVEQRVASSKESVHYA